MVIIAAIARQCPDGTRSSALALQQNALDMGIAVSATLFGGILAASASAATAAFAVQGALMMVAAVCVAAVGRRC